MRSDIPSDIWRYIASFLPVAFVLTLYSVNRTFLEIATETRYRSIEFVAYETAKPLVKHVKDSTLVHSVRIQPWAVMPKAPKASSSWSSSTWKLLHACVSPAYAFDEDVEAQVLRRLGKQTQRIANAIRGLPNLHTYHIDWDEGPYQKEFFIPLLNVIPAIGKSLRTLCLKVPLQYMPGLPALARGLPNLESLVLTIHTASFVPLEISRKIEGLEVFINTLLRDLRSLSIHTTPTSTYLDLGPFFSHLGNGRHLTSFTLYIPFDGGHLANPAPLREFLFKHRLTLESITLGTTRAAARPTAGVSAAKFWIRDTLKNHPPFPELSQLSLSLRPLRTDLAPLVRWLTGMRAQLRVLRLTERVLEYAELARMLDALDQAPLLRVLTLRVRWLSPEVIDLLAERLPFLSSLTLNFTEVVHQEPESDASSARSEDSYELSRESELTLFCQALAGKRYSHWNLTRLAVPESPRGQMSWLDALERGFVGCIPTLTGFEELVSAL
ncbi:hypothetical protein B0H17DRAFT_1053273 [Mycena rosella]|uniref:F-box domain-containing protein n=1 Tax=Mycena rosella TaxID=1033263 RepID=A0AAD7DP66_MYCRO|nr:hypothetical protein B0H17DRAFT_1053273 [Mycena rosella]